jgi:hypothetical protein
VEHVAAPGVVANHHNVVELKVLFHTGQHMGVGVDGNIGGPNKTPTTTQWGTTATVTSEACDEADTDTEKGQ